MDDKHAREFAEPLLLRAKLPILCDETIPIYYHGTPTRDPTVRWESFDLDRRKYKYTSTHRQAPRTPFGTDFFHGPNACAVILASVRKAQQADDRDMQCARLTLVPGEPQARRIGSVTKLQKTGQQLSVSRSAYTDTLTRSARTANGRVDESNRTTMTVFADVEAMAHWRIHSFLISDLLEDGKFESTTGQMLYEGKTEEDSSDEGSS